MKRKNKRKVNFGFFVLWIFLAVAVLASLFMMFVLPKSWVIWGIILAVCFYFMQKIFWEKIFK